MPLPILRHTTRPSSRASLLVTVLLASLPLLPACGGSEGGADPRLTIQMSVPEGLTLGPMLSDGAHLAHTDALALDLPAAVLAQSSVALEGSHWFVIPPGSQDAVVRLEYLGHLEGEDLDLYLYDPNGTPQAFSVSPPGIAESLDVPINTTAFIEVRRQAINTDNRPQNYSLEVQGIEHGASGRSQPTIWNGALPVEATVMVERDEADSLTPVASSARLGQQGPSVRNSDVQSLRPRFYALPSTSEALPRRGPPDAADVHVSSFAASAAGNAHLASLLEAKAHGATPVIEVPVDSFAPVGGPVPGNDPLLADNWQHEMANTLGAWLYTQGLSETGAQKVAVIDTGVFPARDITHALLEGCTIAPNNQGQLVCQPGQNQDPDYSIPHGLQVSLTMAAASNNGVGSVGYAPLLRILPIKASIGPAATLRSDYTSAAIVHAVDEGATVINISAAFPGVGFEGLVDALEYAVDNEVIVVFSAGNSGMRIDPVDRWAQRRNGQTSGVYVVGAIDVNGVRSQYSNTGPLISAVAPVGTSGLAALCHDTIRPLSGGPAGSGIDGSPWVYANACFQGTSYAAPAFSASVALMRAVNPSLGHAQIETMLRQGKMTRQITPGVRSESFGWGLIDLGMALEAAAETVAGTSSILTPNDLNFGGVRTQLPLLVRRQGFPGHSLEFVGGGSSLTFSDVDTDLSGFGLYAARVARPQGAGAVTNTVKLTSNTHESATFEASYFTGRRAARSGESLHPMVVSVLRSGVEVGRFVLEQNDTGFSGSLSLAAAGMNQAGQYDLRISLAGEGNTQCGQGSLCAVVRTEVRQSSDVVIDSSLHIR